MDSTGDHGSISLINYKYKLYNYHVTKDFIDRLTDYVSLMRTNHEFYN